MVLASVIIFVGVVSLLFVGFMALCIEITPKIFGKDTFFGYYITLSVMTCLVGILLAILSFIFGWRF